MIKNNQQQDDHDVEYIAINQLVIEENLHA